MSIIEIPTRKPRTFIGEEFSFASWEDIKPLFENLVNRSITSVEDLKQFFIDRSELESFLSENFAWRYIRMTCDTVSEENQKNYAFFVQEIQPHLAAYNDILNKKALESSFINELTEAGFSITIRGMKKAVEIFREENIAIDTQIQTEQQKYQAISAAMTIHYQGEEITLPKASDFLQNTDRKIREEVYLKIQERRYEDHEKLDELFNGLVKLRNEEAVNAGFKNFRDYMFAAMGRFDYTPQDCFTMHESVAETVVPIINELATERKATLQVSELRPYDFKVDIYGRSPLKPFQNGEDLLAKTIECFTKISPQLADYLKVMKAMGHFDLESRKGKAPGGYNYPLEEIGVPFIFMNATSSLRDLVTIVHEGGHAIHSFEVRNLPINSFRNPPMEVAELASMAMELISMEHWDVFFDNAEELKRAKIEHLESIISGLPWITCVDKFQHWIYENPTHSTEERREKWNEIFDEFNDSITNFEGLEKFKNYGWQRQLHIFEVPFYYIEYGMAQLGAISVWKNYKENPEKGLKSYLNALKLGYTAPISKIYEAANIKFDFSKAYISALMTFVRTELEELKKA